MSEWDKEGKKCREEVLKGIKEMEGYGEKEY